MKQAPCVKDGVLLCFFSGAYLQKAKYHDNLKCFYK
jgi:hypothetical protein